MPCDDSLPTLADGDLRLRPVRIPDDIPHAVTWYHDPEVLHFSEGEGTAPYDAAMIERMFRDMTARGEVYIVEVERDGAWRPIGDAALCLTAGTPITIGDRAYRSQGLGKRVLALLIARARVLGWARMVVSGIFTDNLRALRLYEGAGFRITGTTGEADRPMWTMELPLT